MSKWACLKLWNWFIVPVYLKKYLCIVPLSFFMLQKYLYTPHNFILGVVSYPSYHGLGMRLVYDRLSYVLPVDACLPLLFPRKHKNGKPLPCWCTERFVVVLVNKKKKMFPVCVVLDKIPLLCTCRLNAYLWGFQFICHIYRGNACDVIGEAISAYFRFCLESYRQWIGKLYNEGYSMSFEVRTYS